MAWYKFWKSFESAAWCYVEADSFEEARKKALRSDWEENEPYCDSAWVSKAPEDDGDGNVPDPDDYDFDEWLSGETQLDNTDTLELPEGESID